MHVIEAVMQVIEAVTQTSPHLRNPFALQIGLVGGWLGVGWGFRGSGPTEPPRKSQVTLAESLGNDEQHQVGSQTRNNERGDARIRGGRMVSGREGSGRGREMEIMFFRGRNASC